MDDLDILVFAALFKDAYARCFGHALKNPMSETESKLLCTKLLDQTGLSLGWKSVKNYSIFILDGTAARPENPSAASLDTLARYVLGAPYTTEIQRKNDEGHYPYWFLYREKFTLNSKTIRKVKIGPGMLILSAGLIIIVLIIIYLKFITTSVSGQFSDDFSRTDEGTLSKHGWFVKSKDDVFWNRRGETPRQLTLFTLKGDTWPDSLAKPAIKNLLLRALPGGCFTAEVHLRDFIPAGEWQQSGLLLLEDTTFNGKSVRFSLGFNDNFGGNKMPSEIYLQAITSLGDGFRKPEEVAHKTLFYLDSIRDKPVLMSNLRNSALRIEKRGDKFRFLYSGGANENGAFREIASQDFAMQPKYIGIFALKGFTNATVMPVSIKFFRITSDPCN